MTKAEIKKRETTLIELTGSFCTEKIDADYQQLCEKLILKLGRKRDVPFTRGKLEIWAAAVVYAIGSINFLFDKSFAPYSAPDDIANYFGTKKSTVSNKARQIKDLLKIGHFDAEFSTQNVQAKNPLKDMVMVDGFIVSLTTLPEDLQEVVRQERAAGRDMEFKTRQ